MNAAICLIRAVMPAFAGIHDLDTPRVKEVVDARAKPGHDAEVVT